MRKEYRITLPRRYEGTEGETDLSKREGIYIKSSSASMAALKTFITVVLENDEKIDIQQWGNHPKRGQFIGRFTSNNGSPVLIEAPRLDQCTAPVKIDCKLDYDPKRINDAIPVGIIQITPMLNRETQEPVGNISANPNELVFDIGDRVWTISLIELFKQVREADRELTERLETEIEPETACTN